MLPNDAARTALTDAYRARSSAYENAGNMDAVIADARNAMDTSGAHEEFSFFYDMNLRYCRNGNTAAVAIALWEDFAANCAAELTRYSARERWQSDAARLHMAYAAELAARKDDDCISELRTAEEMGADITDAVAEAASHFKPGIALANTYTSDEHMLTVIVSRNGTMESEPNSTPETATAVPVNEEIHASIGQEGDIDCFTFTLDGDAVVQPRFTFKPTDSASKAYVLTLMDASRREMLKANIGGKESTKVIAPAALTAGTYTVRIENPRFIRQDYTLCLVSMAVDAAEKEPNDSAALATELLAGSACTGVLTTETDVDYYRLAFAEETMVTFSFSFPQSTGKNTAFALTIEQNGKTQWTTNIRGDSGGLEQQLLFPAGEYFVKVKPSAWLGAVYTIEVK